MTDIGEAATVRLPRRGGQGVLVPGHLIVTAAHCIGWTAEGGMAFGDSSPEKIIVADGRPLLVDVLAVEPCADIAILGALDGQLFGDDVDAFEAWCETTTPVRLYTEHLPLDDTEPCPPMMPRRVWNAIGASRLIPAYIRTHDRGWIPARAQQIHRDARALMVDTDTIVEGGTSGGPVIAEDGRLLGVISTADIIHDSDWTNPRPGHFPIPRIHLAAPVWAVNAMTKTTKARRTRTPQHLPAPDEGPARSPSPAVQLDLFTSPGRGDFQCAS